MKPLSEKHKRRILLALQNADVMAVEEPHIESILDREELVVLIAVLEDSLDIKKRWKYPLFEEE